MKAVKIIKINLLALLAFPLLLFATAAKMAAKALEKVIAILGTILIVFGIALLFEIARNFSEAMELVVIIIVCIVLGGIFSVIVIFLLSIASVAIMTVVGVVMGLLEGAYTLSYSGYASLFYSCKKEYGLLSGGGGSFLYGALCLIYTLLRAVNKVIIFFVTHALKILIALSLVLVVGGILLMNAEIHKVFGLNLLEYMKLFPAFNIVYGIVLYAAAAVGTSSILISLGIEWNEWGAEMEFSTSHYEEYVENLQNEWKELQMDDGEGEIDDRKRQQYMEAAEVLNEHVRTFEAFVQEVSPVIDKSDDYALRSDFGRYAGILQEISEEFGQYHGEVPAKVFEKYLSKIREADDLKKSIQRNSEKARVRQEKSNAGGFFGGCDTPGKLEKRYKALCKTYHPDSEIGDEETFKEIQAEYEKRKQEMGLG